MMLKSIKVRDYMTRNLVTFRPEMNLFTAINRLLEHRISGAPVVDGQGHLVGLLSEGDCLRGILSGAYYESAGGDVSAYMTTEVEVFRRRRISSRSPSAFCVAGVGVCQWSKTAV